MFQLGPEIIFPPVEYADPYGLLAFGGDLSMARLLLAYRQGIFPWYSEGQPILWWSPDPRMVIYPYTFHISRSLRKSLRQGRFTVTLDTCFKDVIAACGDSRIESGEGTWILPEMMAAYGNLHRAGFAHSVEVWQDGELAGGMYGVSLGRAFFGESMFSYRANASKTAMAYLMAQLTRWRFGLLDCQVANPHLERMGGVNVTRERFLQRLKGLLKYPARRGAWAFDDDIAADF